MNSEMLEDIAEAVSDCLIPGAYEDQFVPDDAARLVRKLAEKGYVIFQP